MKNQEFYPDGSSDLTASARWKNLFRAVPLLLIAGVYLFFAQWGTGGIVMGVTISIILAIIALNSDWFKKENKFVPYLSIPFFISAFLLVMVLVPRNNHLDGLSYEKQEYHVGYQQPEILEEIVEKAPPVQSNTRQTTTTNSEEEKAIVGTWAGAYQENASTHDPKVGKGNLTLTVSNDMTGIIETTVTRKGQQPIKAKYTVSVTYSNGVYNITGKEFIIKPSNYGFDNFSGSVSNGIFSGNNFKFEKKKNDNTKDSEESHTSTAKEQPTVLKSVDTTKGSEKQAEEKQALATAEESFKAGKFDIALKNYQLAGEAGKTAGYSAFKNKAVELINLLDECDSNAKALLLKAQQLNDTQEIRNLLNNCK